MSDLQVWASLTDWLAVIQSVHVIHPKINWRTIQETIVFPGAPSFTRTSHPQRHQRWQCVCCGGLTWSLCFQVCVCCHPLTLAVVLLPAGGNSAVISCFHEACVSFASIATATSVLAITVDRYHILARPARHVLTGGGATALLGTVWALSLCGFLLPFMEVGFLSRSRSDPANQTLIETDTNRYYTEPGLYYHLLAQIPIFFFTAAIMIATYYKILQELNVGVRKRLHRSPPANKTKRNSVASRDLDPRESTTTQEFTEVPKGSTRDGAGTAPLGMHASVSVIVALRRAVRRHRERRERQKRVIRMSLLIISTFLVCWTPITLVNTVILSTGPGDAALRLRLASLVAAYATTIFHPLLYAFTRKKLQRALQNKMSGWSQGWRRRPHPTNLSTTIPGWTPTAT